MMVLRAMLRLSCCILLLSGLAACGGGGGSGGGGSTNPPPLPPPSALSYSAPQHLLLGTAMATLTPTVTGAVASYSVAPALPPGLSLNTTTGAISGTPLEAAALTTYTITASNSSGSTTFALPLKVFTIRVESPAISRFAAFNTSIHATVVIRPVHLDVATLYATADDPLGVILRAVEVSANPDGSYTLLVTTSPSISPNAFAGNVTFNLCRDANCATPLEAPRVSAPYTVNVLGTDSAWPGNHPTTLSRWAGVSDWSTVQGNAAHTGYVPAALNPDQFTTRWRIAGNSLWSPWTPLKANLTTADGLFYVVSSEYLESGVVYARRETDGGEVWRHEFSGMSYPSGNPAAVSNGVVYVAAGHQGETYMFGFNAANGAVVYQSEMTSQWEGYLAPTIGPNGMLYANAGTYGGMYAFNPTGTQLFFAGLEQQSNWTPAVDVGNVYAYTGDSLRLLDPLTGAVRDRIVDPSYQNYIYEVGGAPVLGAEGSVFAASYSNARLNSGTIGNSLTNFRLATSSIGWQSPGAYPTTPAYRNGVVYAVNNAPLRLEARAETDGALLWSWAPGATDVEFYSEVLVTDNMVFVSTDTATYGIDMELRRPVFSYPQAGKLVLSPNGILYIHNTMHLTAINVK